MIRRQRGMTLIGFIIIAVVAISIILAGVKIVPDYIEFSSVKKVMKALAESPNFNNMTNQEIITSFDKRASTSYVTVVNGRDLIISKSGGKKEVSIEYEVVRPLAFNLSALMDFKASTSD